MLTGYAVAGNPLEMADCYIKYQVSDGEPCTRVTLPQIVIKVTATQRIWPAAW